MRGRGQQYLPVRLYLVGDVKSFQQGVENLLDAAVLGAYADRLVEVCKRAVVEETVTA